MVATGWDDEEIVLHVFHQNQLQELRLQHSREFPYRVPQFGLTANQERPLVDRINHWRSLPEKTKA